MESVGTAEAARSETTTAERIEVLSQKHAALEVALDDENKRPMPDAGVVKNIKREKLAIKDAMERLNTA